MKSLRLVAVFALLVACGRSDPGSGDDPFGRVEGTVFLGPQCAVESVASPCPDLPLADVRVELSAGDEVLANAISDADGRFSIEIEPGSYTLRAVVEEDPPASMRFSKPVPVTVVANQTVQADLLVDTGIR